MVEATAQLVCLHCEQGIEWCAFCDDADCVAATCSECLEVELGERALQPHDHGG